MRVSAPQGAVSRGLPANPETCHGKPDTPVIPAKAGIQKAA